uniref:Glutathione synthase n=1 Tax=Globodera rostochiensis TaxID=31243 RepID=A0A914H5C6_GLORO
MAEFGSGTIRQWHNSAVGQFGIGTIWHWTIRQWDNSAVTQFGSVTIRQWLNSAVAQFGSGGTRHWHNLAVAQFVSGAIWQREIRQWHNLAVERGIGTLWQWHNSSVGQFGIKTIRQWDNSALEQFDSGIIRHWNHLAVAQFGIKTTRQQFGNNSPKMHAKSWHFCCLIAGIIHISLITRALSQTTHDVQALVDDAIDWAHNIFIKMRTSAHYGRSDVAQFAPFTLFPSPIPRKFYDQAMAVQKAMSLLYFRIACDFDFLKMAYKDVIQSDKSVRQFMELLEEIKKEGIKQPLALFFQRSDYMVHQSYDEQTNKPKFELKQIEVNGASIGTACLPQQTRLLHKRVLEKAGVSDAFIESVLPENQSSKTMNRMIYEAWLKYGDPNAIILFMDERLTGGKAKIVHLDCNSEFNNLTMDEDFTLRLDGRPVAVAYKNMLFMGYTSSPEEFHFIRMIERSKAIKASSLFLEFSTSKKIQQLLALPGMVERFFPDPSEAQMVADIRSTFAKLWGLENDDEQTRMVIEDAIAHPERYVLKPNKEGGGVNFWGQDIVDKLKTFTQTERAAHILMERLNPMPTKNFLVMPNKETQLSDVVNEIGIYGFIFGNLEDGTVMHYEQNGNLIRTKLADKPEARDRQNPELGTLIKHIVSSDKDPHHQPYGFKLLQKQLELVFPIALYRASTKCFTNVCTLRGLTNGNCRYLWVTLRGRSALPGSAYFDEMLMRHIDEELEIFSSLRQLQLLMKSALIVSDGTFKQAPKGIYQRARMPFHRTMINESELELGAIVATNSILDYYVNTWIRNSIGPDFFSLFNVSRHRTINHAESYHVKEVTHAEEQSAVAID